VTASYNIAVPSDPQNLQSRTLVVFQLVKALPTSWNILKFYYNVHKYRPYHLPPESTLHLHTIFQNFYMNEKHKKKNGNEEKKDG